MYAKGGRALRAGGGTGPGGRRGAGAWPLLVEGPLDAVPTGGNQLARRGRRRSQPKRPMQERLSVQRGGCKKATLGVLFVHGIGRHAPGDALRQFADPVRDMLLAQDSEWQASSVVLDKDCPCGPDALPPRPNHYHINYSTKTSGTEETWVFAECYWDDVVGELDFAKLRQWLTAAAPVIPLWQMGASLVAGFRRRTSARSWNPLSWYAWLCAAFWSMLIRPSAVWLALGAGRVFLDGLTASSGEPRFNWRFVRLLLQQEQRLVRLLLLTFGDAYAFLADPDIAQKLRGRFYENYAWLSANCSSVAVVAHSQGAALAQASLKGRGLAPKALFTVGSGLGPLNCLRQTISRPAHPLLRVLVGTAFGLSGYSLVGLAAGSLVSALTWLLILALLLGVAVALLVAATAFSLLDYLLGGAPPSISSIYRPTKGFGTSIAAIPGHLYEPVIRSLAYGVVALVPLIVTYTWFFKGAGFSAESTGLPGLSSRYWIEYYSPLDFVAVGTAANKSATAVRVLNPTGWRVWNEHGSYFRNTQQVLPDLCNRLLSLANGADVTAVPPDEAHWQQRARVSAVEALPAVAFLLLYFASW